MRFAFESEVAKKLAKIEALQEFEQRKRRLALRRN